MGSSQSEVTESHIAFKCKNSFTHKKTVIFFFYRAGIFTNVLVLWSQQRKVFLAEGWATFFYFFFLQYSFQETIERKLSTLQSLGLKTCI